MLALFASAFVAAFPAVIAQTFDEYSENMHCQQVLRGADGRMLLLATLEVDTAHRPLGHSIVLFGRGYKANWAYGDGSFRPDAPPARFEIPSVALKPGMQFPATATIHFDGRVVWTGEVPRVGHTLVRLTGSPVTRSFQPAFAIEIGAAGIPSPFRVGHAEIVVTAADGAEITRETLALPDWASLQSELPSVFTRLEAERSAGRCRHKVTRTIVD
jgi:hypothetical protein